MKRFCAWTIPFAAIVLPGLAMADPRDDVLEALGKCTAIADSRARLACYDSLAPQLKAALGTPPPHMAGEPTKAQQESWFGFNLDNLFGGGEAAQTTPKAFGSERLPQQQKKTEEAHAKQIDSITAKVSEYAKTPFGKFIVFLANGQVWRQIQGDTGQARFRHNPSDNTVTIRRAIFGSYTLTINDSARTYKVERMK